MSKPNEKATINIDNQLLDVPKGLTILQAAEQNNIYIPTLCTHKALTPFGGCRMCIVEVEGMRGFPTACTTPVEEGMIIRTQTAQVQAVRMEILQLILSEHTSSCLICDEKDECKKYMGTIRKAGVTTGCRYCSNDGQCELQEVVEKLGVKEIGYPIYYRNLRVEKEDPFYDRDYNLCILCGRCIRMCQEIRTANTLAFKQRGRSTVIGPAYDRTHLDAGCEFCGACVSVCPTGALSEKVKKWDGKPEREQVTTCAFCGVGCQIRLLIKGDKVIGSLAEDDPVVNHGQLCVKGRFAVAETINHFSRLKKPYRQEGGRRVEINWEEAVQQAAEKLSDCPPQHFGMLVSPNCTNEDLYVAQKFVRAAVGSNHIDTSARLFYGSGFNAYLNLMRKSVPLSDLRKASVILVIGLDVRFGRSVVGVELREAIKRKAKVFTINPNPHSLALIADRWLQPKAGTEFDTLESLLKLIAEKKTTTSHLKSKRKTQVDAGELSEVAGMLKKASSPVILVGSDLLRYDQNVEILETIEKLAHAIGAGILPLPAQNNLLGSILMGTYPELLPGGFASADKGRLDDLSKRWGKDLSNFSSGWNAEALSSGTKLKVLYLIGEVPTSLRPPCDFLIFQNLYPPDPGYEADLVLPAAAFTEMDGTFINGEGRIQRVRKAVNPPGEALPDWEILCRIAQKMGTKGFDFSNVSQIHEEIASLVKGFGEFENTKRQAGSLICEGKLTAPQIMLQETKKADKKFPFLLHTLIAEHTYRGLPLSTWVEGLESLFPEGKIKINPEDAQKFGISDGDQVVVTSDRFEKVWVARILNEQPPGTLQVTLRQSESIGPNPFPVRIRKKNV
jgi:predicted molibdopterin-dependent oxidoreductase YjgC